MNAPLKIADRLKTLREQHNLTQQAVAEKIMVSRSSYSHYELGLKQPTIETLYRIAELYQTSIDYIVGRY